LYISVFTVFQIDIGVDF